MTIIDVTAPSTKPVEHFQQRWDEMGSRVEMIVTLLTVDESSNNDNSGNKSNTNYLMAIIMTMKTSSWY